MVISYQKLQQIVESKGYEFFTGELNINLVGIRTDLTATNTFNDELLIAIEMDGKKHVLNYADFTTDPGYYYLKKKFLNPKGCAILKPGQYRGMWALGKHRGKYPALVQVGKCTVYRDRNADNTLDTHTEQAGLFGINMHHAYDTPNDINKYSAGCQVHRSSEFLDQVLRLCKKSAKIYGDTFTYTLLMRDDLDNPVKKVRPEIKKVPAKKRLKTKKKK
jgi:hypothetical protein